MYEEQVDMREKDYYAILGVSRSESTGGIRAAFRRLAKVHHPDLAGPEGTRYFQELLEAYTILSHPETRRAYTHKLLRSEALEEAQEERARRRAMEASGRASWLGESLLDQMLGELLSGPSRRGFYRSVTDHMFDIEVVLTSEEASRGGTLRVPAPVTVTCPRCNGLGRIGFGACPFCMGHGMVGLELKVTVEIPAQARNGMVFHLPVEAIPLILRVFIRVEESPGEDTDRAEQESEASLSRRNRTPTGP